MKYKISTTALIAILIAVLLLPLAPHRVEAAIPAHSESFYVNDFAGVIDEKTENYMVNYGVKLYKETGAQVVLVTVDSTNGVSMEDYATSLFNSWGVGSADQDNGVLLLLSIKDDDYWAVPGTGLETTLNDEVLSQILAGALEPDFAAKDYNTGARKTYGLLVQSLGGIFSEVTATKNFVSDNAGIFSPFTKDELNQSNNRYAGTTGSRVFVVTVKNSGDQSLQEYTYAKFAGVGAGPNDVMLVLDIGGDNYHVLQGGAIDGTLTNDVISGILDTVLEPRFAAKDYSGGAIATADAFHSFFLARADASQMDAAASQSAAGPDVKQLPKPLTVSQGLIITGIYLLIIALISLKLAARNRYIARYGIRIDPYNPINIQRYGVWTGQQGYGYSPRADNTLSRSSSSWGSNRGGGGSTGGGGSGRSSSSNRSKNHGGGGFSRGGGSGRRSSGSSRSGGNSGGGGSSSGGGVGRRR